MPSFIIAQLEIFHKKTFLEYLRLVPKTIESFGGKVIARGGSGIVLEGDWNPQNIVIIEFPSTERANEWWASQEYAKIKEIREISTETKMIILPGV